MNESETVEVEEATNFLLRVPPVGVEQEEEQHQQEGGDGLGGAADDSSSSASCAASDDADGDNTRAEEGGGENEEEIVAGEGATGTGCAADAAVAESTTIAAAGEDDIISVVLDFLRRLSNTNLLILVVTAVASLVSTIVFAILYAKESTQLTGGEAIPTPVILKLSSNTYINNSEVKRMFISGYSDDTISASTPGILRWRNQSDFWYLEVVPLRKSGRDCPIMRPDFLFDRIDDPVFDPVLNTSRCNLYDFRLVIYNDLDQEATVHFHGLTPPSNQDGVPSVSNANIHPKNFQRYRFHQFTYPGLHWMHSHTGFQQAYGVAAPIVLQHNDAYADLNDFSKDDDLVVMFEEGFIYPKCAYSGFAWYIEECKNNIKIDNADFGKLAFLINRREEPLDHTPGKGGNGNIRIRFLNGGSEAPWRITTTFSEENNGTNASMEILATDGQDVERGVKRNEFVLGLANRIDVLLNIDRVEDRDVLITGMQMKHSGNVRDPALRHIVIRGRNTPFNEKININDLPYWKNMTSPILKDFNLLNDLTASHPFTKRKPTRIYTVWNRGGDQYGGFPLMVFNGTLNPSSANITAQPIHGDIKNYTALNQLKFQLPPYKVYRNAKTNVVISTRRGCKGCSTNTDIARSGIKERPNNRTLYEIPFDDKLAPTGPDTCCWEWCDVPEENCTDFKLEDVKHYKQNQNYIPVCYGDRVRILFINSASFEKSEGHPMHLHGHDFTLRELYDLTPGTDKLVKKKTYKFNGPKLDTIWVPFGKAVAFDFDAYNPGEHLFHCHNDFHLENGMMTTIRYMHDAYCQNLPKFVGGENNYPTQFCTMNDCTPPSKLT